MRRYGWLLIGVAALGACGGGDRGREVAVSDSLTRELEIAPEDTTPAAPLPDATSRAREQRSQAGGRAGSASKHPVRGAPGTTAPHAARPAPAHGSLGDSGGVRAAAERRVGRGTDTAQAHARQWPAPRRPTPRRPTPRRPIPDRAGPRRPTLRRPPLRKLIRSRPTAREGPKPTHCLPTARGRTRRRLPRPPRRSRRRAP